MWKLQLCPLVPISWPHPLSWRHPAALRCRCSAARAPEARALLRKISKEATEARHFAMKLKALDCGTELSRQLVDCAEHLERAAGTKLPVRLPTRLCALVRGGTVLACT